jgi:hypothetical protein
MGTRRKGVEALERVVWVETGRKRLVYGDVEGLDEQNRVQTFCNQSLGILLTSWRRTHHCCCSN